MAIYTLSINYIDGVSENKSHLLSVFYKFPNPDNEYKAAMDKSKKLLSHYAASAQINNDFLTWLDLMSRKPASFETVDVIVPDGVSDEEMYLMIASATKPHKKIIVGTHQYWKKFHYLDNCCKIIYKSNEVIVLDKDEAFKELNPPEKITIIKDMTHKNNPWVSGSFYLVAIAVVLTGLAVISNTVHWSFLPIIIIGGIFLIGVLGAMQLRNDDKLKDSSFIKLMTETYKRLPLLRQGNINDENVDDKK